MPSVMAALPNIGGALCSTPQSLTDAKSAVLNRRNFLHSGPILNETFHLGANAQGQQRRFSSESLVNHKNTS